MENKKIKLNIGSGRQVIDGFLNIDITQIITNKGKKLVDFVLDVSKQRLPFTDNSVDEILCDNTLEHLDDMIFAMNEMHRVLKVGGVLTGNVPLCNTVVHWKDPTHKRCFIRETFSYFTGVAEWNPDKPKHPKYADYGIKPWQENSIVLENDLFTFNLSPRK